MSTMWDDHVELEIKYSEAQENLINNFKLELTKAAEKAIGAMYSDVSSWATTDAHTNYYNHLKEVLRSDLVKEISTQQSPYSYAASIRKILLEQHKEELQNRIIEDLQNKVERLQQEIKQIYERRF